MKKANRIYCSTVVLFSMMCTIIHAQPRAQWRGPERNGIFPETELLKEWPASGPEKIFSVSGIGKGYSSAVLADDVYYVTGLKDKMDHLTAINQEGEIQWQEIYGTGWPDSFQDTRCTPTVDEDRIYVISGTGEAACYTKDGTRLWRVNVDSIYESKWHIWGVSESPLIVDNMMLCTPIGESAAMVALDKYDGSIIWASEPVFGKRSYVSPILFEYKDTRLILAKSSINLFAVDPLTGEIPWSFDYASLELEFDEGETDTEEEESEDEEEEEEDIEMGWIMTNTPVFHKDEIFITAGYDLPAAKLKLSPDHDSVKLLFTDRTFDTHHHGVVLVDGYLYGSNWYNNKQGRWICMDWTTGEIKYVDQWNTKGNIQYADGLLYVYEDRGTVGLVKPSPDGFEVISSFSISEGRGPHWAHLGIYDGKLLVRHGEVLMVYDIKQK